ncbi:putative secreted hydrolase [Streptomyces sp. Tu6071]|uniref:beta-N-acetylhexosaminidase n=1 Tax=Streptomyces sp. Tu6071 TaxID=355249 RepID=UPI00020E64CA|nr:glycoside hydrolase family 20 protein [Streptomyces sp. Tu6071]EGJ76964.1 putative secreted hydrolase [Streptomyces sp. Tu6071]
MADHRRQDFPDTGGRRRRAAWASIAALVVAAAVALGLTVWPGGDHGKDKGGSGAASSADALTVSPTPAASYPVAKPPRTIPSVRDFEAARGPGWKPAKSGRVLAGDDALADEAKLLAGELGMRYGGDADPRRGDVWLGLDKDAKGDGGDGGQGGDEAYTLRVAAGQARITAAGQDGVWWGTRTLKQAVRADGTAPEGTVRDRPAKPQRGFMLDIARKWYDEAWIKARIAEIADLKYNQFGLHFSDDQAFRVESSSHPEIVSAQHLTKAQVRSIVSYAAARHVTVVPEIDSPGHLGTVIKAHPKLQLRDAAGKPVEGAVDIGNPESARIVDDLLKEYASLFPGRWWHLGADEYQALVRSDPEASFPELAALARKRYGAKGRVQDLAEAWLNDRAKTVRDAREGRIARAWNDGFFAEGQVVADRKVEVVYWTGKELGARPPAAYLAEGRQVLNYNDEFLYYVLGQPNTFTYPTGQRIYESWTPRVLRGTSAVPASYDHLIEGGGFAVWGDFPNAQTPDQVATGIRMPLRALSEKLWPEAAKPSRSWTDFQALSRAIG